MHIGGGSVVVRGGSPCAIEKSDFRVSIDEPDVGGCICEVVAGVDGGGDGGLARAAVLDAGPH